MNEEYFAVECAAVLQSEDKILLRGRALADGIEEVM